MNCHKESHPNNYGAADPILKVCFLYFLVLGEDNGK